jgi:hypothetical protein
MRLRRNLDRALAAALLFLATGCRAEEATPTADPGQRPELGLMGTIPLYWGEEAAFGDVLSDGASGHWARAQLEAGFTLRPLDSLSEESLAGLDFVLLAQPRALSGAENVALDAWVRAGGRLVLLADPLLTGDSRFPIGDRRRPQEVILLSTILGHWGLQLEFDAAQPEGFALIGDGAPIPVNMPGRFVSQGGCAIESGGVLARCAIGTGQALLLADAALLDFYAPHPASAAALDWLVGEGFGSGKARERSLSR